MHSRTKDTPFNLAFGSDAITLVEIRINSLRIAHFDPKQNESNLQANLDLLEKIRQDASVKTVVRKRQVAQYYNKQVKVKNFEERDLVLRNFRASRPVKEHRKLSPTWEGPYLVTAIVENGKDKLQTLEGKEILNAWNCTKIEKNTSVRKHIQTVM